MSKPWGVVGALVSHQWDVAGNSERTTNITGGQYFYGIPFGDGSTSIGGGVDWSYNHELEGEKWTLPLGIGINKTVNWGGKSCNFGIHYWNYLLTPGDFVPEHLIRFAFKTVIDVPWLN